MTEHIPCLTRGSDIGFICQKRWWKTGAFFLGSRFICISVLGINISVWISRLVILLQRLLMGIWKWHWAWFGPSFWGLPSRTSLLRKWLQRRGCCCGANAKQHHTRMSMCRTSISGVLENEKCYIIGCH